MTKKWSEVEGREGVHSCRRVVDGFKVVTTEGQFTADL